ncbi:hypothetical protein BDB01DRAFT_838182 [Pilobolus umbonatus]|nr:hypothetical protein BDB01DRAFT_838182 [Pilobolus umbonatus]
MKNPILITSHDMPITSDHDFSSIPHLFTTSYSVTIMKPILYLAVLACSMVVSAISADNSGHSAYRRAIHACTEFCGSSCFHISVALRECACHDYTSREYCPFLGTRLYGFLVYPSLD